METVRDNTNSEALNVCEGKELASSPVFTNYHQIEI